MTTETKMTDERELLNRALPFLLDEATKYEDDGSNEPLELARDIEIFLATPPELMTEGDKTAAQSRMIDELTAPVGDGPDWRYAAVSAIEYIDAGDHDEARDMLRSAVDLSDEASAPSAPVGAEGLLADLETIWHSVSDDKETNAAYERLKVALTQQPAAVDEEGVDRAVQAWFESSASDDRASMREAISAYLSIQPGGSNNDR